MSGATEDDDGATAGVPWRSRTVQVVLASTALAPLGVPLVSPGLPVLRDEFGVSEPETSLLVSGYFLVGIVLSPFVGVLTDRVGRKPVLVAGLALFGLLGGSMAFAPSFEVVLALRVLQGTGAAAIFITTVTIIGDTFDGPQRNAVLGVNVAVLSAAAALFPVLGGALVTVAWNAPFLAYFAALPVALGVFLVLPESRTRSGDAGTGYLRAAAVEIATPRTLGLFGATLLTELLAFGVVFTAVPFLLERTLTPVLVGVALLATEAVSTVVAAASGRLARRLSSDRLVALGFGCYGLGFVGAWAAATVAGTATALTAAGAGIGLLLPSIDAAVSEGVSAEYRAGAFSLRNSTTFLGRAAGPILFTGLASRPGVGYESLLLAAGAVALATALAVALAAAVSGSAE
ncbi:MFS transporter [Halosimplex halophilum]|uniref:MFS transporter n=1 Tax=Halosimplex halophilum TaxID=2559572 RepID=UPI00107FCF8F|nr:MFS transporter [Halosimplex halophilum]